jgi:hypothetical protein
MKKINLFAAVTACVLSFGIVTGIAFAQATSTLPDPGTTPDSPFYFLKTWREQIQLFFTFNAEQKAQQYIHLSEVRLAEYKKMIEQGKTDIAQKVLDKYQEQLDRATEKAKELKDKGKDIKDITSKIEESVAKHSEVLKENLDKVPEAVKRGIENAIENSKKGIEQMRERLVGGDKDEHGCIGSAGYSWCAEKQKCLRVWEEQCTASSTAVDTSGWKTYKNEKYGFEFRAPSDWIVEKTDDSSFRLIKSTNKDELNWWEYNIKATKDYKNFKYYNTKNGKWGYLNLENNHFVEPEISATTQEGESIFLLYVGFVPFPIWFIPYSSTEVVVAISARGDFMGPEHFKDFLSTVKFISPGTPEAE